MSFWCRRWMLHSRSPRWTSVPNASPRTWTSTCRGRSTKRSSSSRSSPNDAEASRRAAASASARSSGRADDPHPATTAARARLDQQRVADAGRALEQLGVGRRLAVVARQHGDPARLGQRLRAGLVAQLAHRRRGRPDPGEPGGLARLGERGPLAQEPVARVDGLGAGRPRRLEDRVGPQVALGCRPGPDPDRLVRRAHVRRGPVGVGVDGDRADPEAPAGAHDPQGDLPPVGHQDRREHAARARRATSGTRRTACPGSAR